MELLIFDSSGQVMDRCSVDSQAGLQEIPVTVPVGMPSISCHLKIPIKDVQGYWHPELYRPKLQLDWTIMFDAASNKNFPFISFFNQYHQNRVSIGLSNLVDDSRFSARMNQAEATYDLDITVVPSEHRRNFQIFIDTSECRWLDALKHCQKHFFPSERPSYPDGAWQPVFCTWYAVHRDLDAQWVEANARIASQMGFGTLILDDGWSMDSREALLPATIPTWYSVIGDWDVSLKKFPDFATHVKQVQGMSLAYVLWVAPMMLGTASKAYQEYSQRCLGQQRDDGCVMLNPQAREVTGAIIEQIAALVNKYQLDGVKVDFLDSPQNSVDDPGGQAMFDLMRILKQKVYQHKNDALIEFRQRYCNPVTLGLASQFRANDVPFDFIENLHRLAHLRLILGDHVAVHADPVFWHPDESIENISRHMIASLAGVPMLSMDLQRLSDETIEVVSQWLDFYQKNLSTFRDGKWVINYEFDRIVSLVVETEEQTIINLQSPVAIGDLMNQYDGARWVLNGTDKSVELASGQAFDVFHKPLSGNLVPPGGLGYCQK